MGRQQADAAEQASRYTTSERPPCAQRHLLGVALRRALAGPTGQFWSVHHLLQSLRSLAAGGRLEQDYEHAGWRPRRGRADDRHVHCPRASARRLYYWEQKTVNGPVTRRVDQQDSCGG